MDKPKAVKKAAPSPTKIRAEGPGAILDAVDLCRHLSERDYDRLLKKQQAELSRLAWQAKKNKMSSVIVFEGWDAAGKGSAIRRVTGAMYPWLYRVIPNE